MCLDDATGKVLSISYECLEPIYLSGKLEYLLENLFHNYCGQMDFYDSVLKFIEAQTNEEVEANEDEGKQVSSKNRKIFRIGDELYGEIEVECTMTETGFCIKVK